MITEKLKKECKEIVNSYPFGFKVAFCDTKRTIGIKSSGAACSKAKKIYIERELKDRPTVMITIFHELGHAYCFHTKKYVAYHKEIKNKKELIKKLKQGIRAERYVDKWGEEELTKYDKRIKWQSSYFSKEDIHWYKNVWCPKVLKDWNKYGR